MDNYQKRLLTDIGVSEKNQIRFKEICNMAAAKYGIKDQCRTRMIIVRAMHRYMTPKLLNKPLIAKYKNCCEVCSGEKIPLFSGNFVCKDSECVQHKRDAIKELQRTGIA